MAAHGNACTPAYTHAQPCIMSYDTLTGCLHCLWRGLPRRRPLAVHISTHSSATHIKVSQTCRDATTERPAPCRQTRAHRSLTSTTHIHTRTHIYTHRRTHARTHAHTQRHTHCCRAVTLERGCTRTHTWAIHSACMRAPSSYLTHTHARIPTTYVAMVITGRDSTRRRGYCAASRASTPKWGNIPLL